MHGWPSHVVLVVAHGCVESWEPAIKAGLSRPKQAQAGPFSKFPGFSHDRFQRLATNALLGRDLLDSAGR